MKTHYSPEDQMILEAEYKKNPKPNKTARAEIVKLVKLNAKEIQVGKLYWTRLIALLDAFWYTEIIY